MRLCTRERAPSAESVCRGINEQATASERAPRLCAKGATGSSVIGRNEGEGKDAFAEAGWNRGFSSPAPCMWGGTFFIFCKE